MKKNRYSKPVKKEVLSQRKLAREAQRLEVEVQQQRHEMRCQREDLETARGERGQWRSRAESMREENERLRKQVEGLTGVEEFLHVTAMPRLQDMEMMMRRHWVVEGLREYHVGVNLSIERFETMERSDSGVFVEAIADQVARAARKAVMENLRVRR